MFYEYQHFGLYEHTQKEYGENFSFPAHLHKSFEIIILLDGEMTVTVDEIPYVLHPGEALLIFPNQIHSLASTSSRHMLCIFSTELVKAYTSKVSGKIPESNFFLPDPYLISTLDSFTEQSSLIEKKGLFYSLCGSFDRAARYRERKNDDSNLLYRIFDFVETNYSKECSLKELALQTGFSYSYLSRYFKNIVGLSFNDYVNRYRISNACYLLNNTEDSVLQCALDSGYTSLRSFNRNFMEKMSMTPNAYRKMNLRPE